MNTGNCACFAVRLMLGASLAAIGGTAFANDAPADGAEQQATDDQGQLEQIVVTAQKVEQNLQDVPLAISAISADKVEKLGIRDAKDLSGLAPNVTIVQGTTNANAAVISIRGIPTPATETFGLDTANGLYIDGVFIARSGGSALDVTDIERVEVLRGPQGTLFGRNTTGGGIAFISRAPSKQFRLTAQGGYGNYNAFNGRITLDPGEIAGIATSFTYSHRQRNGIVDNLNEPDDSRDPGAQNTDSFRVAAKADIGGTGSIQYIFDWSRTDASPINFQLTNVAPGGVRPPVTVNGVPVVVTQQAPVAPFLQTVNFLDPRCAALATPNREWRKTVCNDINSRSTDKAWGHNVQVQNDFGAFHLKSTTGYRFWNNDSVTDLDGIGAFTAPRFTNATLFNGMPVGLLQFIPSIPANFRPFIAASPVPTVQQNLFDTNNRRRHKQFSQEVEIGNETDNLDWVLGAFYFWEKGSEYNPQNSGFVLDTNGIFLGNFGPLGPSFVAANPARYRLVQTLSVLDYTATAESTAVYGQATFYPGGKDSGLRLTAGGRYTWDNKSMVRRQNGAAPLATPEQGRSSFSKFTWNLMVGYDVTDNVNVYGRIATGYRSGGFNAQDPSVAGVLPSFKSENVTSYEVGLKSELFDRRVRFNLAGYYNEYKDLALAVPITNLAPGTFATKITNAGKVTYTGVEAELTAVLTDNFTFEANAGYVDIKYKEFLAGLPVAAGQPLVNIAQFATPGYTSPFTANLAMNAQFPLGDNGMRLTGRVSYAYEDGKYSFSNVLASPFNEAIKGENRNIVDAQVAIDRIPLAGSEAMVRFWVKNLTDENNLVRAIDFGALGYGGGYYADPRTYGVTVGVKF
ncbi:TonB-dependent receptor [Novosphingobium taihuense]|uniref:Iron complex outermembrane receptor protein n=1 Tax=Novosphingobium taihuense TaxID=260085 RepID=A0A7W7ABQ4_9SPHN|nr:TonB-dependent receptor [Novosphingobium taihuense]MBB4614079.1 iron complex outermembrane receptor protein [Novosphingobium taihuense]TWH86929.1 iron complex outermembrane receptor protein [Novosphingobium taihuense]